MSDITSEKNKIQSESVEYEASTAEFAFRTMGATINWILDKIDTDLSNYSLKTQTFVSSGTFTPPADVSFVYLMGCGGGSGGFSVNPAAGAAASIGGNGSPLVTDLFTVTPSTLLNVIIGSGGSSGNNGGDSSFDSKIFPGAKINEIGSLYVVDETTYLWPVYKNQAGGAAGGYSGSAAFRYMTTGYLNKFGQDAYGYIGGAVNGGGGAGPFGNGGVVSVNGAGYGAGGSYNSAGSGGIIKVMYFTKY